MEATIALKKTQQQSQSKDKGRGERIQGLPSLKNALELQVELYIFGMHHSINKCLAC